MKARIVFYWLLCLVFILLPGCADLSDENVPTPKSEPILAIPTLTILITPTPTVEVTPTILLLGSDPFPFSLDEVKVFCQYLNPDPMQDDDHWADALIPGVSTVDDLLALTDVPEWAQPARIGTDYYSSGSVWLQFYNGILEQKADPRTTLGEIVQHYGHPEKVVWVIPRSRYHEASYETYLVYPKHNALFFVWDKVTWFTTDTEFGYSDFSTQEGFDIRLSAITYPDYNRYEELVWPCGE